MPDTPIPDIVALRQFYSSPLGRLVKTCLRNYVLKRVHHAKGEVMVGVGYSMPLLRAVEESPDAPRSLLALMPAYQGAMYWPVRGDNRGALVDETNLPLHANTVHWLVMLHALEFSSDPTRVLEEAWRVLVPGGRMLLMVPHHMRPWRWSGESPFRAGAAYRKSELLSALRDADFTISEVQRALVAPPWTHPLMLRIWKPLEWFLSLVLPGLGSVLCVEVEKQIYAAIRQPVHVAKRKLAVANIPAAAAPSSRIHS